MALTTYVVKSGDCLSYIAAGRCGANVAASIPGNTTWEKVDALVRINNIPNRDLIYIGQVLKLNDSGSSGSGSGSGSGSSSSSTKSNVPIITDFGLQSEDTTGRAMYVAWSYSRDHVKNYKVRWMYYAENMWQIGNESETTSYEKIYCNDTYSAPERATKVKVQVLAQSQTKGEDGLYWYDVPWSAEKIYDFSENPPYPPDTPDLEIKDLILTASIDNIDPTKVNADTVEFEIIKDNSTSIGTYSAIINTTSNYVAYTHTVAPGSQYKVRARCKKGSKVSGWSDFSQNAGTKPSAPTAITTYKANTYSNNKVTAYLEWTEVTIADSYEIQYSDNKEFLKSSDATTTISSITFNHYEITSLELGKEYFFRVRAVNEHGESDWTEYKSIVLGTTPVAPTTWSSTTVAVVGEPLNLYWVHNAEDNSSQTFAELRLFVDGVQQVPDITIENDRSEADKDKTSVYELDTNNYPEGSKIEWQIRTAGVTKVYGEWSIKRIIDIYAKPTLDLSVTTLPDGAGDIINTLTSFPFYIRAFAGPQTQYPIGYQLKVVANEFYETVDDTGRTKMVNKGEAVYSKHFDISNVLIVEMSADNLNIEADIEYTITCMVTMNSGLTAETSHDFIAKWTDVSHVLNAEVSIDYDTMTASITPFCEDQDGTLTDGMLLSVYRREFDGTFKELSKNIPNTNNVTISDPHPALDYARYRIVGKVESTGSISYYDIPGVKVGGIAVIIQWDEEWTTFDAAEENSAEAPKWSGSMLKLPYNIDVSDSFASDVELVEYIGRSHPVAYYGTQLGETATWTVKIPMDDKDTLYAIRRLARWTGNVYVREPSGSGYWANISVSYSQAHKEVVIPVTLSITRVEGGV